jgi:hypothetical protein
MRENPREVRCRGCECRGLSNVVGNGETRPRVAAREIGRPRGGGSGRRFARGRHFFCWPFGSTRPLRGAAQILVASHLDGTRTEERLRLRVVGAAPGGADHGSRGARFLELQDHVHGSVGCLARGRLCTQHERNLVRDGPAGGSVGPCPKARAELLEKPAQAGSTDVTRGSVGCLARGRLAPTHVHLTSTPLGGPTDLSTGSRVRRHWLGFVELHALQTLGDLLWLGWLRWRGGGPLTWSWSCTSRSRTASPT